MDRNKPYIISTRLDMNETFDRTPQEVEDEGRIHRGTPRMFSSSQTQLL